MAFQALNHANTPIPQEVIEAFTDQPKLRDQIAAFIGQNPYSTAVFQNISTYVLSLKRSLTLSQHVSDVAPASKKRKLDVPTSNNGTGGYKIWADKTTRVANVMLDVSFSVPVRKKMRLEWVSGGMRAVNGEGEIDFGVAWEDIEQVFCLPVPEKAKRQHNFVIIPHGGDGLTAPAPGIATPEPFVWTVVETGPREEVAESEPTLTTRLLNEQLSKYGRAVIYPDGNEFASEIPPTGRPGEKSYHVRAHRGSKDGYLFFLSPGIVWAFKKPLLFLPFSAITSISYTSVLQRTFNLNVIASTDDKQEIEFSMIDQSDYAGIDAYVKRHGLHDASLAASRKAKVYNVNKDGASAGASAGAGAGTTTGNGDTNDHQAVDEQADEDEMEETELQKAERMLQDEEDELEEDYVEDDYSGEEEGSSEEEGWEGDNVHGNGVYNDDEGNEE